MTRIELVNGHSIRVVVSSSCVMFKRDRRSWRVRFFSRPWQPWIAYSEWYHIPASMLHADVLTINPALIDDIDRVLAERNLKPQGQPAQKQVASSDLAEAIRHNTRLGWPEL